jgi:hypothetical protein
MALVLVVNAVEVEKDPSRGLEGYAVLGEILLRLARVVCSITPFVVILSGIPSRRL